MSSANSDPNCCGKVTVQSSMRYATGLRSRACVSQPSRAASIGMAPPPENISSTFGRCSFPASISSAVTVRPVSLANRSTCASRMCLCASLMTVGLPGYLQSRSKNLAALALPRLCFLLSGPFSGTNNDAGTSDPYTAALQATRGRLARQTCKVDMCPFVRGSLDAAFPIEFTGRKSSINLRSFNSAVLHNDVSQVDTISFLLGFDQSVVYIHCLFLQFSGSILSAHIFYCLNKIRRFRVLAPFIPKINCCAERFLVRWVNSNPTRKQNSIAYNQGFPYV